MVFAGLEPKDPNYLGAEIEIALGPNYEKHVIDVPSIVCVPKGLPHGPIVTRKVEKPFAHYAIGLARNYNATKLPGKSAGTSSKNEYGHLIKLMSATGMPEQTKIGSGNADWLTWPKSKDLEGFIVNFTWGFYSGLGNWHDIPGFDPHVHEALQEIETCDYPDGVVVQEIRRGYLLNGKVFRPSLVKVSCSPASVKVEKVS